MEGAVPALADSFTHALRWITMLLVLQTAGWLAIGRATATWRDRGFAMALPLAMLALAVPVFALAHLAPVFRTDVLRSTVALALLWLLLRGVPNMDSGARIALGVALLRFLLAFGFYTALRGLSHDVIGLEKFMDFGFLSATAGVERLPAPDPWFSGHPINYYYFGHYLAALLCKLSGVPVAFGYNLMLATLFAMVFCLAFAFVTEMTSGLGKSIQSSMALVAALWLSLGGNIHGFLYGFVRPWLVGAGLAQKPERDFLISDPTRFVGWNPPTNDKLIHEFPAYAFYVGDLHGHLINLPFVLLLCCVLLAWLRADAHRQPSSLGWLAVAGALTGVFAMTNTWDAAMYAALLGTLLLGKTIVSVVHGRRALATAISHGLLAGAASVIVALTFLLSFVAHSRGFFPTHSHTPVWQWLVLYGLQSFLAVAGVVLAFGKWSSSRPQPERWLLTAMTAFGIGFALLPEFIYLEDIYDKSFYRGNTAFKFGFQAFTLLTLAACIALAMIARIARERSRVPRTALAILLQLVLVPPLYYGWFVLQGGFGVWAEREWTLDGQRYLALSHPEDRQAAAWLTANADRTAPLVEAVGDSYTFAARISANTGLPTVIGWPVHEQLWRGSDPDVWKRRDDVNRLYETESLEEARTVLSRYRVRYIVVGRYERERYGAKLNPDRLTGLGRVVFRAGETFIVDTSPS
ncbi:DUF2298 domain-containing protein [Ottowia thiooxydans]|uniref:DUF2298 domain-containing protein n=1 Tax=Ottowia thiooxydans TaxID=219182 RepID=UPI00042202B2|nr:DUF2298 domain-containing protein [Ottowia thiooxydans]